MKQFRISTDSLTKLLKPDVNRRKETIDPYFYFDQDQFNKHLDSLNLDIIGELTVDESQAIANIKLDLEKLNAETLNIPTERLEFDLAIIFHKHLRMVHISRFHIDNIGMWRWLSLYFFKKEVEKRRADNLLKKRDDIGVANAIFTHGFGLRTRDIFPRRYFLIGERLYDKEKGYQLLQSLSERSKYEKAGGFSDLVNNLIDTSLLSPNDWVSKTMAKIMLTGNQLFAAADVVDAFVRYNGFKKRLLNNATERIFENEICLKVASKS